MKYYYVTFRSVTYGQRGEKLLSKEGYRCNLQRTPRWMEEQGCGYALKIRGNDVVPAVQLLRSSGLSPRKVYVQKPDGQLEEMNL